MWNWARAALWMVLALAACDDVPSGAETDTFPFNAHVDVDAGVQQVLFVARVENASAREEPDAQFSVSLYNGPLFVASGAAGTGRVAAGESRTASVAFNRALAWNCFQWSIATRDGRRRTSELIC